MNKLCVLFFGVFFPFSATALDCLPQGINFYTQAQVDQFPLNYPGCTLIGGPVEIMGPDIVTLLPLAGVTSVGELGIDITSLATIQGLESLTEVRGNLAITENDLLVSLEGLSQVQSIDGGFVVGANPLLTSLSGVDGIGSSGISEMGLVDNPLLWDCAYPNICQVAWYNSNLVIYGNAPGCSSREELREACASISVRDERGAGGLSVYPNPVDRHLTVRAARAIGGTITVSNSLGREFSRQRVAGERTVLDLSDLPGGLYVLKVVDGTGVRTRKIVKR
jgi:hypothetical protein